MEDEIKNSQIIENKKKIAVIEPLSFLYYNSYMNGDTFNMEDILHLPKKCTKKSHTRHQGKRECERRAKNAERLLKIKKGKENDSGI